MARNTVTDATPRVYVRFDDGLVGVAKDARHFLERGFPVALGLNFDSLRATGTGISGDPTQRLTYGQIRDLIRVAHDHGTEITFCNHARTNWSAKALDEYTWDDILHELDPTPFVETFGVAPLYYVQPGDAGPYDWCLRNRELIRAALEELGYIGAIGLENEQLGTQLFYPSATDDRDPTSLVGAVSPKRVWRPGIIDDPFRMQDGHGLDLGVLAVTRDGTEGSHASPFVLGTHGGSFAGDYGRTWTSFYTKQLAAGASFLVGLHSEDRTNATAIPLSTGTAVVAGHWSTAHVAWTLARLHETGHIRLVGMREFVDYITSDYADGVDLVANPTFGIPHVDIGDLAAGHYVAPRGMTHYGEGITYSFGSSQYALAALPSDADGDQLFDDVAGSELANVVGPLVSGPAGRPGGLRLKPAGASTYYNVRLGWPNLTAGRYRLTFSIEDVASGFQLTDWMALGQRRAWDTAEALANGYDAANAKPWRFAFVSAADHNVSITPESADRQLVEIHFELPENPPAADVISESVSSTPGLISDGASATTVHTVPGALPGARVFLEAGLVPLPAGVSRSAAVTAENEVTITYYNNTGGDWTLGTSTVVVYVEDLDRSEDPLGVGASSPWIFTVQVNAIYYGAGEAKMSAPVLRRYGWR